MHLIDLQCWSLGPREAQVYDLVKSMVPEAVPNPAGEMFQAGPQSSLQRCTRRLWFDAEEDSSHTQLCLFLLHFNRKCLSYCLANVASSHCYAICVTLLAEYGNLECRCSVYKRLDHSDLIWSTHGVPFVTAFPLLHASSVCTVLESLFFKDLRLLLASALDHKQAHVRNHGFPSHEVSMVLQ